MFDDDDDDDNDDDDDDDDDDVSETKKEYFSWHDFRKRLISMPLFSISSNKQSRFRLKSMVVAEGALEVSLSGGGGGSGGGWWW